MGQVPETGFWVLIKHLNLTGVPLWRSVYRCIDVQFTEEPGAGGVTEVTGLTLICQSWLEAVLSTRVQFAPVKGVWGSEGFVYDLDSWQSTMNALLGSFLQKPVGELLEQLIPLLVKTTLPPSLTGGRSAPLGSLLDVVYNEDTAKALAPMRSGAMHDIIGYQITSPITPQQTLMSIFMGLFQADPRLVELFPCIEPSANGTDAATLKEGGLWALHMCLIYRYRPWFSKAITAQNVELAVNEGSKAGAPAVPVTRPTACEKMKYIQTPSAVRPGLEVDWYDFHPSHVQKLRFRWSDADRVNLAYASAFFADGGALNFGTISTPLIKDAGQVNRHGLRVSEYRWPYFPPSLAAQDAGGSGTATGVGSGSGNVDSQDDENGAEKPPNKVPPGKTAISGAPSFWLEQFACHDGTKVPQPLVGNCTKLAQNLQVIQQHLGGTIRVISGFRTPAHNTQKGGAKNSQHMVAAAADFTLTGRTPEQLFIAVQQLIADGSIAPGGVGIYDGWVHYDVRGSVVLWDRRDTVRQRQVPFADLKQTGGISAKSSVFSEDLQTYAEAINEIGWALTGESERFCRGTALVVYRPYLQPGHWVRFYRRGYCLTAYIESIGERLVRTEADGGAFTAATTLTFVRGTLRYYDATPSHDATYQAPLMTVEANAGGSPANFDIGNLPQTVGVEVDRYIRAKGALAAQANAQVGAQVLQDAGPKAFSLAYGHGIIPGPVPSTKARTFIIVHQSDTSTVKALVDMFRKPQRDKNTPEVYFRGTNYTVDKDGSVIEWADPATTYTRNVKQGRTSLPTEQTISVDFIGKMGEQLTTPQLRAGAALMQKLIGEFNINAKVAPDRKSKDDPLLEQSEDGEEYGIFRHRSFSAERVACCGSIDPQQLLDYGFHDQQIKLVPTTDPSVVQKAIQ